MFLVQYLIPLRELKADGLITTLIEIPAPIDGENHIIGVEIDGAINFEAD